MTPEPTPSQELREELDEQIEKALSSFERLLVGKYPDYKVPEIAEVARLEAKQDIQALFTQHELSRKQEWVESLIKKLPLSNCVRHHSDDFSKDCTCDLINRDQITKTIKEQSKE